MSYLEIAKRVLEADAREQPLCDAAAYLQAVCKLLAQDPRQDFSTEELRALSSATVEWRHDNVDHQPPADREKRWEVLRDWPAPPCPTCNSLELWEDVVGNWRCLHCVPPTVARRFRQLAERIRKRGRR